jgi:hypothetical protein
MQVSEIIISRLKQGENEKMITNGQDTTITCVSQTSFIDTPFMEAILVIENCSDSTIAFAPNASSVVTLNYTIDSIAVKKNVNNCFVKIDNDSLFTVEPLYLAPGKKLYVSCKDYLFNNILMRLYKSNIDNTLNVLRILPVMKFTLHSISGQKISHCRMENVKIRERPSESMELYVPPGYWIIKDH